MLLSIITSGKNDQYAGNFKQRHQHNLDKLNDSINKLNTNEIELIAVDWGSEEKLSDVLNTSNFTHTKFLHIPSEIAKKYSPDSGFSIVHALNAGFRRSKGRYIFFIDGDSYVPYESLALIYNIALSLDEEKEKTFFWASRYHLPYEIHSNTNDIREIDKNIEIWEQNQKQNWRHDKIKLHDFGGTAMGLLLSRDICEESTLYYEVLNKWGWLDIEIHHRLLTRYSCVGDLEDYGVSFFHLDHHSIQVKGQNGINPNYNSPRFEANDENWGLVNENLKLINFL
jgi:glycosyltransferase involved in cell wall biosynthesis